MKKSVLLHVFPAILLLVSTISLAQYSGTNPNVAVFKPASVSDTVTGFEPDLAVDDLPGTFCSIEGTTPSWLLVDLNSEYIVDGYGLIVSQSTQLPKKFILQGSLDGETWIDLGDSTSISATGTYSYDVPESTPIRFVRLYISIKHSYASISEFRVFGELQPPAPPVATAAINVTTTGFRALWFEVYNAEGYRIDISTNTYFTDRVSYFDDFDVGTHNYLDVTGMTPGKTYHYRVRAYNSAGSSDNSNKREVTTLQLTQSITFDPLVERTYGDMDFVLTGTASSGLPVTYASSDPSVATVSGDVVTITGAGTTTITASQDGNEQYEAALPVDNDLIVNQKQLTVTGTTVADKPYDGTADAALSGAVLSGVLGTDDVTLVNAETGTFAQTGVGTNIAVSTSMATGGTDQDNYTIIQPTGLSADIVAKELIVTGASAESKVYDGTTDAIITGATLSGVVDGDDVSLTDATSGTFAQTNVGTGIAVTVSMGFTGADAGNYSLTQSTGLVADITARELLVIANDRSREECASNPEFTLGYAGFAGSEDPGVFDSEPVPSCSADENSPAGTYDITVSGGSASNYNLVYITGTLTVTPDITSPTLTVQDITIQLDAQGNATITPADLVIEASDNCGLADTTLSQSVFTTDDIGQVLVDVVLTDLEGNAVTQGATVTVEGSSSGIREELRPSVTVYPNPTSGKVFIDMETPASLLKIIDITGKVVLDKPYPGVKEIVDLSNCPSGIYIFQIRMEDRIVHFSVKKK